MFDTLDVFSIYNSIDGEVNGFYGIGQPTTFIRLKGCNLHCKYCDSQYANQEEGGLGVVSIEDILKYPLLRKITITGGEPLLQKEGLLNLLEKLAYKFVSIETNGTIPIIDIRGKWAQSYVRFIVDYKLDGIFDESNWHYMGSCDILKFVVGSIEDYERAKKILRDRKDVRVPVAFSPVMKKVGGTEYYALSFAKQLAERIVMEANYLPYQTLFSLQLHKVLWPECSGTNER